MTTSHPERTPPGPATKVASGRIVRVDASTQLAAVNRLLGGGSREGPTRRGRGIGARAAGDPEDGGTVAAERFVAFSSANKIRLDAMWALLDDRDGIVATLLAVPNPGRTAILFTTVPADRREIPPLAGLIRHACDELKPMEVDLAQVLLEPRQLLQRDALVAAGFTQLARLSYMERPLRTRRRVPTPEWPADVTIEPYDETQRPDLLAVLDASYVETLDCPGLRGLRRTEDILDGHVGTGEYDPALWTIMRIDGRAEGALLLSRSPASEAIELVYIGLAPPARRRGLGRQLLRHGLHRLAERPERSITLAVDDANHPAIALYRSEGFHVVLRRIALIRSLRNREVSSAGPA